MGNEIRDPALSPGGDRKIDWVKDHMPVLRSIEEDLIREKRPWTWFRQWQDFR